MTDEMDDGRRFWLVTPGDHVAWRGSGNRHVSFSCVDAGILELCPGDVFLGAWDHAPSEEEVTEVIDGPGVPPASTKDLMAHNCAVLSLLDDA